MSRRLLLIANHINNELVKTDIIENGIAVVTIYGQTEDNVIDL
jgi:hypothetical protein